MINLDEVKSGMYKVSEEWRKEREGERATARFDGIDFISYEVALVKFYIPFVEKRSAMVKLNVFDRLRGINIVQKAKRVAKKWENKVEEINKEREWCKWANENIELRDDQEW